MGNLEKAGGGGSSSVNEKKILVVGLISESGFLMIWNLEERNEKRKGIGDVKD